jgi:hypothetical protein
MCYLRATTHHAIANAVSGALKAQEVNKLFRAANCEQGNFVSRAGANILSKQIESLSLKIGKPAVMTAKILAALRLRR